MIKAKKVRFLRTLTVVGCMVAYGIARAVQNKLLGALLMVPVTLLSGICALMYYRLDKDEKDKVYKLSALHLYTIIMYPYYLFVCVLFLNILYIFSPLHF